MTKDDFVDLMGNSGRYSEILGITSDPSKVSFSESSEKGSSVIDYRKNDLMSLKFLEDMLFNDSELEEDQIADKKILDTKQCVGYYSLTFLGLVKSFCNILDLRDKISFSLKSNHPLRISMAFKKLTNASLLYYLAPRVEEGDPDDQDDVEFTESEDEQD